MNFLRIFYLLKGDHKGIEKNNKKFEISKKNRVRMYTFNLNIYFINFKFQIYQSNPSWSHSL